VKKSLSHARSRATADERLRAAGLKKTAARLAVLRYLEARAANGIRQGATHADAADAIASAGFDRATAFRVLTDFVDAGLARRVEIGDHVYRFELATADDKPAAPLFTCEGCAATFELPPAAATLHAVRGAPKAIMRARVYVRGLCDSCS
jgi:Fur family ferric uptake transcriptional regulator